MTNREPAREPLGLNFLELATALIIVLPGAAVMASMALDPRMPAGELNARAAVAVASMALLFGASFPLTRALNRRTGDGQASVLPYVVSMVLLAAGTVIFGELVAGGWPSPAMSVLALAVFAAATAGAALLLARRPGLAPNTQPA